MPFLPLSRCRRRYAFPVSGACSSASASSVRRRTSSSLMVPLRPSPSVLILRRPTSFHGHVLSRVCCVGSCPPLAPLPLTCISGHLSRPWCPRARRSGRRPSSLPMVWLPSSSIVCPCDGVHRLRWTTNASPCGWVDVTCDASN
jgi:hypothetical protein